MRLDDFDFDDEYGRNEYKKSNSFVYTICVASLVLLCILVTVFISNDNGSKKKNNQSVSSQYTSTIIQAEQEHSDNQAVSKSVDELISGSTLTADDLDFWHDYDDKKTNTINSASSNSSDIHDAVVSTTNDETAESNQNDFSTDGKHTLIKYSNGQEEWIDINPYLALNTYNYANLVYVNNIMKYYDNHVNVSYAGLDLTKNDDYVDFFKVKRAGIDFVMLRIGSRGYSSGEIIKDDSFEDNYRRAKEAGLDVGVYFFSQAVTKEEAIEEAQFVINTLAEISGTEIISVSDNSASENGVSGNAVSSNSVSRSNSTKSILQYPVVYYIEEVNSNDVRSNSLNQLLRTNIAINFMDTIRNAGYIPMVYGNKEYLLKKLSFGSLIGYDVWMGEEGDTPDFPYQYNMWRYTTMGKIDGVQGAARLSICFTNYSER